MGLHTTFNKDIHPKQCKRLMGLGYTIVEASQHMCINENTFYLWKKKYPEFRKAAETGKLEKVKKVVSSGYKKANGYDYFEETYAVIEDTKKPKSKIVKGKKVSNGRPKKPELILVKKVKKHIAPDSGMIQYILNNQDSANWKTSSTIDATVKQEYVVLPPQMPVIKPATKKEKK
jgi:hypothetical protein